MPGCACIRTTMPALGVFCGASRTTSAKRASALSAKSAMPRPGASRRCCGRGSIRMWALRSNTLAFRGVGIDLMDDGVWRDSLLQHLAGGLVDGNASAFAEEPEQLERLRGFLLRKQVDL